MKTIFSVNEAGYTESVSVFSSENEAEARDFFNKKKEYLSAFEPAAKLSSSWRDEVNQLRTRFNSLRARSCWDRGVNGFALVLLESYEEICKYCENNGKPVPELCEETLLNGATDWESYCYGGCALIYDADIAAALCTPSELKKTDFGRKNPNSFETWMDVQARAYSQASHRLIIKTKVLKRLR